MEDSCASPRAIAQRVARALTQTLATRAADTTVSRIAATPVVAAAEHHSAGATPPAQSTAYVSMLSFAYTNSDVAQLFSQFGKVTRVTVLRNKQTRKSRGVAFVQFARAEDCARAVAELHETELEGYRLHCSVVKDNGRSHEFQRKRKYAPAAPGAVNRCFECGEYGHFSYNCPRNVLGARERPAPASKKLKKKKKKGYDVHERGHYFNDDGVVNMLAPAADSDEDMSLTLLSYPSLPLESTLENGTLTSGARKRRAVGNYFSDESASDGED